MRTKPVYALYVDGALYGKGPLEYMSELISHHLVFREMYGRGYAEYTVKIIKPGEALLVTL